MVKYPEGLLSWAGHRSGGVRRLFDLSSGRPTRKLIRTNLLSRLETWAAQIAENNAAAPRAILLVGGPGNGKTEAVEACIRHIDEACSLDNRLVDIVASSFKSGSGQAMPRLVQVDLASASASKMQGTLSIVQDASATDTSRKDEGPAQLFLSEVAKYCLADGKGYYIACVNRGVIDDALARAIDQKLVAPRKLLEDVIRAVGLSSDAPSAWPLEHYPEVAVWPMDMESLLVGMDPTADPPAAQLIDIATATEDWPAEGTCAAGDACPFCYSRRNLATPKIRNELLKLLRWYELASGKRWNFRDLGSLVSYLLANVPSSPNERTASPCEWAAKLIEVDKETRPASKKHRDEAIYLLVAAQYQHALFSAWPAHAAKSLRNDIKALNLESNRLLMGLYHFLGGNRARSIPAALEPQLNAANDLLDPALADPDDEVQLTSNTRLVLRDLDARFSQSVAEGLAFIRRNRVLSGNEVDLLDRLAEVDAQLSGHELRNRKPVAAARVQMQVRDFACRLVRRSIGVRVGAAQDGTRLDRFRRLVEGDPSLMHEVAKEVERLLNDEGHFTISLNTTFGEPMPPPTRRAVLTTSKQRVRSLPNTVEGRPPPILRFLKVGQGASGQTVPLTFELFKSVQELSEGMLSAALPRTVVALLDTTRAKLSGRIVRDGEELEGAEIRIGSKASTIGREMDQFVVRDRTER